MVRALRGRARPEVRPYRADIGRARALSPGTPITTIGVPFLRALRGRARPKVRPYRAHICAEPGLSARGFLQGQLRVSFRLRPHVTNRALQVSHTQRP